MKVTLNWLRDFVDVNIPAEDLAKRLTNAGMEVEEIIYQNEHLHHVVVGKILKIDRHPQADKLVVCQVDIGGQITQIITAATNVFEGATVPVSLPGADLCNGIKIEKSKLRGVDSYGMFCSGQELGIDENYFEGAGVDGILILPDSFKAGTPIDKALMLNDVVFDIGITPNRPDCMSVIGIAREVCAVLGEKMAEIDYSYKTDKEDNVANYIDIDVKTPNCPRYMAGVVKDIKLERSPLWLRSRLFAVGIKPINTIVDITNYILIEMGQPLHAFDQSLIEGKKIIVRQASNGEEISVLNHNTYKLNEEDIVIADVNKPMVIGGVIGGTNSCINENSKVAVLESAVFNLKNIRMTSKKIGVRTDSSARYSKGVNLASAELGLKRALHLIDKIECGKVVEGYLDKALAKNEARNIVCSVKEINKILGVEIPVAKMGKILNCLGIKTFIDGDKIHALIPPYREDIEADCDLAEEIIRLYGYDVYDDLDYSLFENAKVTVGKYDEKLLLVKNLKQILINKGFYESVNFSMCPSDVCQKLLIEDERTNLIRIANPLSEDISCVRTCMAHASLVNIAYNQNVGNKNIKLFESGRVYLAKELPLKEYPVEKEMLSFVASCEGYDFFYLKGVLENLLSETSLKYSLVRSSEPYLHPGISADVVGEDGVKYASFGQIHPKVAKNYSIAGKVFYAEINIEELIKLPPKKHRVNPISKYPIVERDLAVVVNEDIAVGDLSGAIKSACGKLYFSHSIFDIYRNPSIGEGKKSVAFNIRLSDESKTLNEEDINAVIKKVIKSLAFRFDAKIRE